MHEQLTKYLKYQSLKQLCLRETVGNSTNSTRMTIVTRFIRRDFHKETTKQTMISLLLFGLATARFVPYAEFNVHMGAESTMKIRVDMKVSQVFWTLSLTSTGNLKLKNQWRLFCSKLLTNCLGQNPYWSWRSRARRSDGHFRVRNRTKWTGLCFVGSFGTVRFKLYVERVKRPRDWARLRESSGHTSKTEQWRKLLLHAGTSGFVLFDWSKRTECRWISVFRKVGEESSDHSKTSVVARQTSW